MQGKLEDARHANSNVAVEMANVQKTIQNYKILLVSKDHAVEKQKRLLMYLEVGLKQLSNRKKQPSKAKDLLAAAREKLDLLKAEEAEKAQVVQEAHEGLKAAQERLVLLKNVFLTLKMLQNYWSKPNLFYQLRWLI